MKIDFSLSSRRFIHEISSDRNARILVFDAKVDHWTELEAKNKGQLYEGTVEIQEKDTVEQFGTIRYVEAMEYEDKNYPHSFRIVAQLPSSTFQILLTYNEKILEAKIGLDFKCDEPGSSFSYGFAADGSMIDWDVEIKRTEAADSFQIAIVPKERSSDR